VVLGVEHLVPYAPLGELGGQLFRLFYADRAHQHRLAALVRLPDLVADGREFFRLVEEHEVVLVVPDDRLIRGDDHDVQLVDLAELGRLGVRVPVMPRSSRTFGRNSGK
jgi:hypothetical protein